MDVTKAFQPPRRKEVSFIRPKSALTAMRSRVVLLIAFLVVTGSSLAGCLEVPADDEPQDQGSDDAREAPPAEEGDDQQGNETEEPKECWEYNPPRPVPPDEHEVATVDEIRCAGQFTVTKEGSGKSWSLPTWDVGDWWVYEISAVGLQACHHEEIRVEDDSQTNWSIPVYMIETERTECDGEPKSGPSLKYWSQGSLKELEANGFIDHHAVFPFKEGKSWSYMQRNGQIVEFNDLRYDENHLFGTSTIEAWIVEWSVQAEGTSMDFKHVWAPDVKNILEERIQIEAGGVSYIIEKELIDSNYEFGGLLPGLPGLPGLP